MSKKVKKKKWLVPRTAQSYKERLVVAFLDRSSKLFCKRENKGGCGKEMAEKAIKGSENLGCEQENVYF